MFLVVLLVCKLGLPLTFPKRTGREMELDVGRPVDDARLEAMVAITKGDRCAGLCHILQCIAVRGGAAAGA